MVKKCNGVFYYLAAVQFFVGNEIRNTSSREEIRPQQLPPEIWATTSTNRAAIRPFGNQSTRNLSTKMISSLRIARDIVIQITDFRYVILFVIL